RVVAELAEDHVTSGAAGHVVVAEAAGPVRGARRTLYGRIRAEVLPHVGDVVLGPPRDVERIAERLSRAAVEQLAAAIAVHRDVADAVLVGAAVEQAGAESLEARAGRVVVRPLERDVVAEGEVALDPTVHGVIAGAADEDV